VSEAIPEVSVTPAEPSTDADNAKDKNASTENLSEDDLLDAVVKSATPFGSQKPRERKRTKHPRRQSCKWQFFQYGKFSFIVNY
jgi:hypothetical protein